ncbi:hypothetical protein BJX64DRAFT_168557 [Aspergillus heterothallicus]
MGVRHDNFRGYTYSYHPPLVLALNNGFYSLSSFPLSQGGSLDERVGETTVLGHILQAPVLRQETIRFIFGMSGSYVAPDGRDLLLSPKQLPPSLFSPQAGRRAIDLFSSCCNAIMIHSFGDSSPISVLEVFVFIISLGVVVPFPFVCLCLSICVYIGSLGNLSSMALGCLGISYKPSMPTENKHHYSNEVQAAREYLLDLFPWAFPSGYWYRNGLRIHHVPSLVSQCLISHGLNPLILSLTLLTHLRPEIFARDKLFCGSGSCKTHGQITYAHYKVHDALCRTIEHITCNVTKHEPTLDEVLLCSDIDLMFEDSPQYAALYQLGYRHSLLFSASLNSSPSSVLAACGF